MENWEDVLSDYEKGVLAQLRSRGVIFTASAKNVFYPSRKPRGTELRFIASRSGSVLEDRWAVTVQAGDKTRPVVRGLVVSTLLLVEKKIGLA